MQIKIGKVPGRTQELQVNEGTTIAAAMVQAGLSADGHELRYNGATTTDFNKLVADGAIILLTPRIKGNSDEDSFITAIFGEFEYTVVPNTTVGELASIAGSDIEELGYTEETIVRIVNERKFIIKPTSKVKDGAEYGIAPIAEALPNPSDNSIRVDAEPMRLVVGDVEIVINKIR